MPGLGPRGPQAVQAGAQAGNADPGELGNFGYSSAYDAGAGAISTFASNLQQVSGLLGDFQTALRGLTTSISNAVQPSGGSGGMRGASPSPTNHLTTGTISASGNPGTQTPSGSTITAGTMRGASLYAGGEVLGHAAGAINTAISNVATGGTGTQAFATRQNLMFGGGTGSGAIMNTMNNLSGVKTLSAGDFAQGLSTISANPFLYTPGRLGGTMNTMNALQGMNPLLGTAGSANIMSALASPQFMNAAAAFGGPGGGLFNSQGKMNNPQQMMQQLMKIGSAGTVRNTAGAKWAATGGDWSNIQQNLLSMHVPMQMIQMLQTYMASGENMNTVTKAMSSTVAGTSLELSSAQNKRNNTVFQAASGAEDTSNRLAATLDTFENTIAKSKIGSTFINIAAYGAKAASALSVLAGATSKVTGGASIAKSAVKGAVGALAGAGEGALVGAAVPLLGETGISEVGGAIIGGFLGAFGDPSPSDLKGPGSTQGMQYSLSAGLKSMFSANPNLQLTSGTRTSDQQSALYKAKGGMNVAPPGLSAHQRGQAADVGPPSQYGWISKNASKFGLYAPAGATEPWHLQAMGDPTGSQIVSTAMQWIGTPYLYGGAGPPGGPGDDCSGFTMAVFAKFGINLPHGSVAQSKLGTAVNGLSNAQPGDLLFFNTNDTDAQPGHVAIYYGNGKMISADKTGTNIDVESVWGGLVAIRRFTNDVGAGAAVAATAAAAGGSSSLGAVIGLTNNFIGQVAALGAGAGLGASGGMGVGGMLGVTGAGVLSTSGSSASSLPGGSSPSAPSNPSGNAKLGQTMAASYGWGSGTEWNDLYALWQAESGWSATADNSTSGAYGIPQALPANKMASAGADYMTNPATQIKWGLGYIQSRYGDPIKAWAHEESIGWYEKGAWNVPETGPAVVHQGEMIVPAQTAKGLRQRSKMRGRGGGGNSITLNMPIQVVGSATQQDAKNLVRMVMYELERQDDLQSVSSD